MFESLIFRPIRSVFVMSTVFFRVHAWVFLFSFLNTFAVFPALTVLTCNILVLLYFSRLDRSEPILAGIYSLAFPMPVLRYATIRPRHGQC